MKQLSNQEVYQIHYDHSSFFYYGDIDLYQTQLRTLGLHVFDVILLCYLCLEAGSQREYIDEFTKMAYHANSANKMQRSHHHTASLLYFSVKNHINSRIGIDVVTRQLRKFKLDSYVYGHNKQTMSVFIRPV